MAGVIRSPEDIVVLLHKYRNRRQEHFIVITLNGAHEVIKTRVVTIGILNKTIIHPREVFWNAIKDNAATVVIAHNHPSGKVEPSPEDDQITERMCAASKILGFYLMDHIIFNKRGGYYSYAANNQLDNKDDVGFLLSQV